MTEHPSELISAYADGELSPEDARQIENHLRLCTECARELALIQSMGGAMKTMSPQRRSVWEGVHRRITFPIGWVLFVAGLGVWVALATYEWFRQGALTAEWLGATAIIVGLVLLLVGVAYEQYREWKETPYRDVQR
jgi:anti-sigma factor RsiW